jgi:Protein of unknown function (DUF1552)
MFTAVWLPKMARVVVACSAIPIIAWPSEPARPAPTVPSACAPQPTAIRVGPNIHLSKAHSDLIHTEVILAEMPNGRGDLLAASMYRTPKNIYKVVVYASWDKGKTWAVTLDQREKDQPEKDHGAGDPTLARGPGDEVYYVYIDIDNGQGRKPKACLRVFRSRDGGRNWDPPTQAPNLDRPFLAVDRTQGKFRGRGTFCSYNGLRLRIGGLFMTLSISRRTALKGMGVALALPFLESVTPGLGLAGPASRTLPRRLAFVYVPNGVNMSCWTPTTLGAGFDLPRTLEPLAPFRDELLVLSGLTCDKARPNGDGPGDHARAMAAFLTGRQARKTDGADIRAGVSVDQLAAQRVGAATRFASLELGCEGGRQAGNCDSGYSCAYSSNLSWRSDATPNPKEINPRLVFDRLFGNHVPGEDDRARAMRDYFNQSILDFVRDDANRLRSRLGSADLRRMDEYLTSVREIERRIQQASPAPDATTNGGLTRPGGIPTDYRQHIRLLTDLLVLAFQTDLTRIATFVFANEGSNRNYRVVDISDGHHDLSHHGRNQEKLEKLHRINRFHIEQFAYLLSRLKSIREGDRTLLDNCMIMYGSGNGDGNRHNHDELPILLAGKGSGTLSGGRHIRYQRNTPLCNLYVELLDRMGVSTPSFGDSTGRLPLLS